MNRSHKSIVGLPARRAVIVSSALLLITLCAIVVVKPSSAAGGVSPLFDINNPANTPFPSNLFTVPDSTQNTGLRVALPKPDCSIRPTDCEDLDVINGLDGFNLLPRLSVRFDGPIDLTTINNESLFLIRLGDIPTSIEGGTQIVGVNRIVWDPITNTLHVESDKLLDQHTRYALIVTNALRDVQGRPLESNEAFQRFRQDLNFGQTHDRDLKEYRKSLLDALAAARAVGIEENNIVIASVFSTLSATASLEQIRDQIKAGTPDPADFNLGSDGTRTVFPLDGVTGITFKQQTGLAPTFSTVPLNLSLLRIIPGAVGQVAFGKYLSPDYMVHPGEYIPEVGTRSGTPQVQGMNEVYFNLFLPAGAPPPGGWPVAIFGHGSPNNKNNQPLEVAATVAAHGIATIAISFYGNGAGPLSTLTVNRISGAPVTLPAGGRGIDQNHDNLISAIGEGRSAAPPDHRGLHATRPRDRRRGRHGRRRVAGPGPVAHLLLRTIPGWDVGRYIPRRRAECARGRPQFRGHAVRQPAALARLPG
jgi:hypothetical protein